MRPSRNQVAITLGVLALIVIFFFAPIVPYTQSVAIRGAYRDGFTTCFSGSAAELANGSAVTACLEAYRYPAESLTGYATPSFSILGRGGAPFPTQLLVTQGNHSALLFFSGGKLVAAEDTKSADVIINPVRSIDIESAIVAASDFGQLNASVMVRNIGADTIQYPTVYLTMAGFSYNTTESGLTWIEPRPLGVCPIVWPPGGYCIVSQSISNGLPPGKPFNFYVEVRGYVDGRYLVFREGFHELYPEGGVGPAWVDEFVQQVNQARGGSILSENSTLDRFAAIRFANASKNFQISDYGFVQDVTGFFHQNGTSYAQEVLLYPSVYTPEGYATFLSEYALGHWAALTDLGYRHFGYAVAQAPYYVVSLPCSVYEIPHGGINITQYFQQRGCTTSIEKVTWLVIVLTP